MRNSLTPVARLGASDCPLGRAVRVCSEFVSAVPYEAEELLGIGGPVVVKRWITVLVDDVPVLAATSYLPVEVAGGATDDRSAWQDSDVGVLALVGHAVRSVSFQLRAGPPTPAQASLFRLTEDDDAVSVLSRRYWVESDGRSLAAGVLLLAPSDRLVLESGPGQWVDGAPPRILLVVEPE